MQMGFRHRLALFLVVTLAAVQVLTALVAYTYLRASLVEKAKTELTTATRVFQRQLNVLSERVADDVQVLSLDYALRQAIAQQDHDTELSALRNHGHRVGATRMMLVGLNGKIDADTGAAGTWGKAFVYSGLLDDSAADGERTSIAMLNGAAYWIVVAPVRAPVPIAFIAAFIPLDDAMLEKLSGLSDTTLSIALAGREGTGRWNVLARTASGPAIIPVPSGTRAGAHNATVDDKRGEFLTVTTLLKTADHSSPVAAILGYPMAEAFAAYRSVIEPVLFFLGAALLLAAGCAMLVVRNASKPIESLAAAARRIAGGDYTPPPHTGAEDELGLLSDALIGMTQSIADREAALTSMIGALEVARTEAVKANEAKSQFLANMSHELRTPLNAIVGFGDMLHQEILGPLGVARYREYAADICASGQRLLGLVSRMLDLAEVEAGTLTLDRKSMSPAGALQQAVAAIRPIAEKERITLETTIDPANIPAISGDADKLRQAFTSVLHNAVKFTPSGGRVAASMMFDGRDITVRIEDCGAGMSAADIEVVTRPFHRLRSALDGQHQGAGLGLPFAKAIVDLHDGSLIINSAEGAGTTIEIRLPSERPAMSNAA
jgi:signal transduction histidine kinase